MLLDPYHIRGQAPTASTRSISLRRNRRGRNRRHSRSRGRPRDPYREAKNAHFADAAEMVITGVMATVVQYADFDDRSLQTVKDVVSDPAKLEAAIKLASNSDAWDGMLARLGSQLTHFKDKELASRR